MDLRYLITAVILAVLIGMVLQPTRQIVSDAEVGARAVAKTACSCVFIARRSLEACRKDDPPGFDMVRAHLDREEKAVKASVFWVIRAEAVYQGATGCAMD